MSGQRVEGSAQEARAGATRALMAIGVAWLAIHLGAGGLVVVDAARLATLPGPDAANPAMVLWRLSWAVRGAGFTAAFAFLAAGVLVVAATMVARPWRFGRRSLGLGASGLAPPALVAAVAGGVGMATCVEACLATIAGSGRFVSFERMQAIRDAGWQDYLWLLVALPLAAAAIELLLRGVAQAATGTRPSWRRLAFLAAVTPVLGPEPFHLVATLALAVYLGWVTARVGSAGPALGSHALAAGIAVLAVEAYPGAVPMGTRMLLFVGGGIAAFIGVEVVRRACPEVSP